LCSFACHYGYCPAGPCVCLAYGAQVPEPPVTGVAGYPLAGLDASYISLCSYTYNHGYYPTGACTSNPDGSPQT
jgi:glucan endo-1,3-alpha-glucosidase